MEPQPLLDRRDGGALFIRPEGAVGAAGILRDAASVAAGLGGGGGHLLNLCRDRYHFAVGIAAGLLAGRTSLLNLPPDRASAHPGCAVLDDAAVAERLGGPEIPGPVPRIPADHLAAVVFTSGSTGTPVGHPKRWGELVARSRAAAAAFGLRGGSVIGMVPPQHMYGFETTVLLPLHAPVASWCGPAFFPADVAAAVAASPAPPTVVTTPLQLRTLLSSGVSLRGATCISATAPLDVELAGSAEAAWSGRVLEIFGATECGSIGSRRPVAGPDWTPYPGVELLIRDGEVTVLAEGAEPVRLADVVEAVPGGFRLLGRRTDLVKLGGRRASLLALNRALTALPGVDDGTFVVPEDLDRRSTARLVAVVVAPARTGADILADLRGVIDPVFLPRRVIQVDALPRNAMGKLPRQALLDLVSGSG